MLDQAFSARNFRRIYDCENRRGRNVDRRFFPNVVEASGRISAASERIRNKRRENESLGKPELKALLEPLYAELELRRQERDALVDAAINGVAEVAGQKSFQLALEEKKGPKSISLFPLQESAAAFFIGKQIQSNMSRLYGIKPADRRSIVRQVKDLLSTSFDLYIVRTDVSTFYESIKQDDLIKEIEKDHLLSLASKSHIKCIINSYAAIIGKKTGIPRGVGVSAYLSELYMRAVDERIRQIEGVTYYARYVDDIIAIFSPTAMCDRSQYLLDITKALSERALVINQQKTKHGPSQTSSTFVFDYLGYAFTAGGGNCELEMSAAKVARYRARIDRSFDVYQREAGRDQKGASRRLVARIKFMTGNIRLVNSKGFAFSGIYYNNSDLTKFGKLIGLDEYLKYKASVLKSASLRSRLLSYSFNDGFKNRPFYRYSTKQMAAIVKAWQYES